MPWRLWWANAVAQEVLVAPIASAEVSALALCFCDGCHQDVLRHRPRNHVITPAGRLTSRQTDVSKVDKGDKDGQDCKTRFDKLTKAYKKRILPTMLQSRTNEEFGECEQLFEDFLSQVNDFGEKKDVIEESSVMMLKLEMEAKDASDGSESGTPLQRTSVVDVLQHITTAVDNVTGEDTCLKMVTSFLKDRLEQEDMREVKRSRRED
ncbi:hypothetical protein DYB31_004883 [Aphanomyces astaci]|uniref:Uncharacterized protein n=2 Tax=Aphanomyces astaci TaxID=112090 RepID=A0A397F1J5_APHAT|nr:hypothetical protein DYB31_004883 [Aphanomyces astaci]